MLLQYTTVILSIWCLLSGALSGDTDHSLDACSQIIQITSSSTKVYYPGNPSYIKAISHWANGTSTQLSKCVVEPTTAVDVGKILKLLGSNRTPFAVKGGGHGTNPGFSSTPGVHISMRSFSSVTYKKSSQTVDIGAGLLWDDVYAALHPHGVNVAGARALGVGVSGFLLGGGYSWLSNQYGLSIDTIVAYELVLPTGQVIQASKLSHPDLFFALKGGYNNFGIVTGFTMQAFHQPQVWGGTIIIDGANEPIVATAVENFSNNVKDTKAGINTLYNFSNGSISIVQIIFYNGPLPPAGIFDELLAIPSLSKNIKTSSFQAFMQAGGILETDSRALFHTVSPLKFSQTLLEVVRNETLFWGTYLASKSGTFVSYAIEPFDAKIYTHNKTATAYPADRSTPFYPYIIWFSWTDPSFDQEFYTAARESSDRIRDAAFSDGQIDILDAPLYPNIALFDTPLEKMYGINVPRLHRIKTAVDPMNVMGLAGGFKL
ncbi:hypothetical protein BDQ12DRAFT_686234 [Crucibulum laeve]|uniref:FAD-binding PCMH-type domain-containing protein n=1 Tax=Crucibulum laeve TaxID=68775 RepID=A0A5C3LXJ5_9AGAR|nr:hypothetical protein BDQ12DRAFT_686234 [Crucibulum laeve]